MLAYDLYASDKDDGGVKILSRRIVTARVGGTCWLCQKPIVPGTKILSEAAILDRRQAKRARTCRACCDAMARAHRDDGDEIEHRIATGRLLA